jgi:NADH dehydrogenase
MQRAETLRPAVRGAEVVVQSANFPNYPMEQPKRGWTFESFDGEGTERLVAAARAESVSRFVFIGGAASSHDPPRPYMRAIRRGEQAVLDSGLEAACIEPTLVFGPNDHGLNRILRLARHLPVLPVPGGQQLHQPLFSRDLGELVAMSAPIGGPQGRFPIGGPDQFTLDQVIQTLLRVAGVRRRTIPIPIQSMDLLGAVFEKLPGGVITRRGAQFLGDDFVADNTATLSSFPIKLTSLEDGLRSYL